MSEMVSIPRSDLSALEKRVTLLTEELSRANEALDAIRSGLAGRKRDEESAARQRTVVGAINRVLRETLSSELEGQIAAAWLAVAEELTGSTLGFLIESHGDGHAKGVAVSDPGHSSWQLPGTDPEQLYRHLEARGLRTSLVRSDRAMIFNDPGSHPDSSGTPPGHPPITNFLGVPLRLVGQTIGLIGLANKASGYTLDDQQTVEALSVAFVEALMHQRSSRALAEERRLLRTLIDALPDHVYAKDLDGRMILVNEAQARVAGLSHPMEAIGKTDLDVFPADLAARYMESDRAVLRTGGLVSVEEDYLTPEGEGRCLSSIKAPLRDGHGSIVGVVGMSRDITQQKQAEEALARERDFAARIMQTVPSGVLVVNWEGAIVFANAQAERVLGVRVEQILQRTFDAPEWRATDLDGRPLLMEDQPIGRVLATGRPVHGARQAIDRPDGQRILLSVNCTPLVNESGEMEGAICSFEDITEQLRMSDELDSLARFPQENPSPVFRVAASGTVLLANEASLVLLRSWGCGVGEPLPEPWRAHVFDVLREGAVRTVDVRSADRTFSLDFVPIADRGYVSVYGVDITERKRLEGQLLQAQKMETVGRLAGGVAHDFNNLLTAIGGYAGLVKISLPPDSQAHNYVDQVILAAERAGRLTRQLLAFSRRQIIEQRVIDLNALMLDLHQMLRRIIGENVELVTVPAEHLWAVKADPGQIEQVLVNLAVNARDAMPDGGRLTIETANVTLGVESTRRHLEADAGDYVMLAVIDTGTGMTDEAKDHLFEPFYTTKSAGRGTGLGLSTVYGIVKQHQGDVWVYSEPGQGTTFKIYLPRVLAPATDLPEKEVGELPRGDETVLLVEDESIVRNFAGGSLKALGYTVIEAVDGNDAIEVFERHKEQIDLLLTDVVLPGINGKQLADHLRTLCPDLAVLFASGYTDDVIAHSGVLDEGTAFLQKPFTVRQLAGKVRAAVRRNTNA